MVFEWCWLFGWEIVCVVEIVDGVGDGVVVCVDYEIDVGFVGIGVVVVLVGVVFWVVCID